ncbi:DUF397 domain-containing protein [Saccharopolyspora sp. NPDC050642]|uniref:DUF397 domain-containing protein n=1 Tax=Saccharopolyspora sp. NPDC050642 TaxID=3157099 RepID=UPI0033D798B1
MINVGVSAFDADSWFKSSYSSNAHHCVEAAMSEDAVAVRDTKDRDGGTLVFAAKKWAAFISSTKE